MISCASRAAARFCVLVAAVLAFVVCAVPGFLAAGTAHADQPTRLPTQVVDSAGVLTDAQRAKLQSSIDQLYSDHQVQLWVVYVKDFNGLTAQKWASQTSSASDLGDADVLLAVATEDRSYYMDVPAGVNGLDQQKVDDIARGNVVPELKKSNWAGAGQAAVDGINDALAPSHTGLITAATVGGVVVVGGAGAVLYSRRRRRRTTEAGVEAIREQELTVDQLAQQPLDVLDPWSREVLTDTDNAIRTSEDELNLAVGEFGTTETAPFSAALTAAKKALADSFALRQRLDDAIPETPDEKRSMLVQIITSCTDADRALDAQVSNFDEMRNLLINADSRFTELTQEIVAVRARLDGAQSKLDSLIAEHGETVLSSIIPNVTLARQQVEFAERSADQGREAASLPAGRQGPAVAAIRSAEGALTQATKLLDAIDNADDNIAAANTRMPALIDEVDGELKEAASLTADGGAALATAVSTATTALSNARTGFAADPLGTFTALVYADAELDKALDDARSASSERTRRAELLNSAVTSAQAKVSAASDFISTRRGAVQSTARTRLSEAARLLEQATSQTATDPNAAADTARRAGSLADEALMAAQADVAQWQQAQQPRQQQSSGVGGAVLTGILVDSFLRGSMRGGGGYGGGFGGGGYSSGGRSPGSFGGSGSSGRIGTGGRF